MFDYNELEVTGTFYIQFAERVIAEDVESLIRYWYKSWFDKQTNPALYWIYYNAFSVNDLIKVTVNLDNCSSNNYVDKDFLCATDYVKGDNRKSLVRTLMHGVNNAKTKIAKIDSRFNVLNNYNTKVSKDIPNPYIVNKFTIKDFKDNSYSVNRQKNEEGQLAFVHKPNLITVTDLVDVINILSEQEDNILNTLSNELDTATRYKLMRQQLDKLEVLNTILELTNKL